MQYIVQRVIDGNLSLSVMTDEELIRYIDEDDLVDEAGNVVLSGYGTDH